MSRFDEKEEKVTVVEKPDSNLAEKLLKTRTISLFDSVGAKSAKEVIQGLFLLEADDAAKPITLFINSPGGEVHSGFAIYDVMRFIKPTVRVVANGLCASAGVIVYLGAKKENRFSLPNARFLIHQPLISGIGGSTSDIKIVADEILKTKSLLNEMIARETGQPVSRIQQDADRDYWMTASQAKEYGLVSKIVETRSDIK